MLAFFILTALEFILVGTLASVLQKLSIAVDFVSFILRLRQLVGRITRPYH